MVKKISSVRSTSVTPQANGLTVKGLVTYEDGSTDLFELQRTKTTELDYSESITIGNKVANFTVNRIIKQQAADLLTMGLDIKGTINGHNVKYVHDVTVPMETVDKAHTSIARSIDPNTNSISASITPASALPTKCGGNYWCDLVLAVICAAGIDTACAYDGVLIIAGVCALVCLPSIETGPGYGLCIGACTVAAIAVGVPEILAEACSALEELGVTNAGCKSAAAGVCAQIVCP